MEILTYKIEVFENACPYFRIRTILKQCFFICLISLISCFDAKGNVNKFWFVTTYTAPLKQNSALRYYLEPHLRLMTRSSFFKQSLMLGGIGYQLNPAIILLTGVGSVLTQTAQGRLLHESRYWQQVNWLAWNTFKANLNIRFRLEERHIQLDPQIAIRFRERAWLRVPIKNWKGHYVSSFDEIFFNFNHPNWVSPYTFEQNRFFIGLGTQITPSTMMDIGYLNQYLHSYKNEWENILFLSFTIGLQGK